LLVVMGALYSACLFLGVNNASSVQPIVSIERTYSILSIEREQLECTLQLPMQQNRQESLNKKFGKLHFFEVVIVDTYIDCNLTGSCGYSIYTLLHVQTMASSPIS
jgi:hypothetical protein